MASHYQAHPGPGPSSYYPQSPPQQGYVYGPGTPGPGPAAGPNGYPYQYTPSPMASHHPGMPPASPRMTGRGGPSGTGAAYIPQSSRGGHAYQPQPHPNYRPPYAGAQYPHPQMQPKYPGAYQHQPPYPYAPPPPPASAWGGQHQQHQHQPLSPLPKDAPMSPLQEVSPAQAAPPAPYYPAQNQPQHQNPVPEPPSPTSSSAAAPPAEIAAEEPVVPSSPTLPSHSSYGQIGTISASSSASSPKPADTALPTPPGSPRPSGAGGWAIWSRRPMDPTHAPGIIISPRARPPPDVVEHALDARTPPPSPILAPQVPEQEVEVEVEVEVQAEVEVEAEVTETETEPPSSGASTTDMRTPTTTTTTIPSSPVSSATSISLSATPPKVASTLVDSSPPTTTEEAAPMATPAPAPTAPQAAAPSTVPQDAAPPAAPSVPPPKKSWASLLRPTASTAATPGAPPPKNGLPTSSVVGVSIPATAPPPIDIFAPSPELLLAPRGLVNTGNMCFANAVLQALVHCPPFAALVARLGTGRTGGLLGAMGAFVREFVIEAKTSNASGSGTATGKGKGKAEQEEEEEEREAFVPTGVYDALKGSKRFEHMRGGQQEDAEEFLGFFLDTLEEELLALVPPAPGAAPPAVVESEEPQEAQDGWLEVGRKNRAVVTRTIQAVESPISRIFRGKFRSTLRAPGKKDSVIVEDWRALGLDIQRDAIHTIQDALAFIANPQAVQTVSGADANASLQILIAALPPVLVLHVKRFYYDPAAGVVKLAKPVAFGPELEVGGDVLAPNAAVRKPVRYKLFAAVYHHGVSAAGGHYTLDFLHSTRGWVRIDDELVSDVRAEDVFGFSAQREEARCAYLLFYRRVR
ncbi:hypothetical protein FB451DRAFT_1138093 [Mycena latifolia]|nr:hypothetical protein FB451DRAFT_1138093 [Mycena latifolia]